MADLETGDAEPTCARLHARVDAIEAHAPLGLDGVRALLARTGADELRRVGIDRAAASLIERF
jgi:hypothetical protein